LDESGYKVKNESEKTRAGDLIYLSGLSNSTDVKVERLMDL